MKAYRWVIWLMVWGLLSCGNDVNVDFPDFPHFPPSGTNCLNGQGAIVSQSRSIADDFDGIDSFIFADIFLSQGPRGDIVIEGQSNIADQIDMQVVNGVLRLTLNRCVRIAEAVKIYITLPEVNSITHGGVGDIMAQNDFNLSNLHVTLSGTGDIRLRGTSARLDIRLTGVGDVRAFELNSDTCEVVISGVGDAEVFVNDELDATISGTGNVRYKGNPSITSNITGTGNIIDAN